MQKILYGTFSRRLLVFVWICSNSSKSEISDLSGDETKLNQEERSLRVEYLEPNFSPKKKSFRHFLVRTDESRPTVLNFRWGGSEPKRHACNEL